MNLPVSPSPAPSAPAGSLGRSARAVFSGSTSRSGRQCESGCPRRPRRRSPAGCRSVFFTLSESETKEGVGGAHSLRLGDSPFILNSQRQRAGGWSCRARAGPPTSRPGSPSGGSLLCPPAHSLFVALFHMPTSPRAGLILAGHRELVLELL